MPQNAAYSRNVFKKLQTLPLGEIEKLVQINVIAVRGFEVFCLG